ncbi:MAG: zinc-dependent alcohol dehydrogenase family protein [Sulfuricaulis sp.]|uniref:zinc-dependent alcohol dehydrogenase family protein n=1 Tax=Sulfuricaulis sp. TaxID=2003553 RepID=UPI0025D7FF1C|nr:zinc-dependent alcohol dehydrogenase family protein [Sulfuricaulis sp.]MCR4346111.1 zinc-dependent alcohol dehydrogenase family protein [Sulfuricaulis sp.]
MKAIVMKSPGGPEVLQLQDLPEPKLTRNTDMLVRVKAAGVNPVDTKMRANPKAYPGPIAPVLGCDGAGVVQVVGSAVTGFEPGDEVYYSQGPVRDRPGSYAEAALVDYRLAAKKPKRMSFTDAAAAPLVLITAWEALHDRTGIQSWSKVLVHAGAGGVGHVAIQLARIAGAEVCTTVGSTEKAEFARSFGANHTINYREKDFVEAVLDWTGGQGVDIAFDTVGGKTLAQTFSAVRYYGDVVTLLAPGPEMDWSVPRVRNQRVSFELMLIPVFFDLPEAMSHQGGILRQCTELFEARELRIHVDKTFPLEHAAEAHALVASGKTKGKVVLTVD